MAANPPAVPVKVWDPLKEPPPGSWASVAWMMAKGDNSGFDWDAWKEEMKERDHEEEGP